MSDYGTNKKTISQTNIPQFTGSEQQPWKHKHDT